MKSTRQWIQSNEGWEAGRLGPAPPYTCLSSPPLTTASSLDLSVRGCAAPHTPHTRLVERLIVRHSADMFTFTNCQFKMFNFINFAKQDFLQSVNNSKHILLHLISVVTFRRQDFLHAININKQIYTYTQLMNKI